MSSNYFEMTDDELEREQQRLMGERARIKADLQKIQSVRDLLSIKSKAAQMTDKERALLAQIVAPQGIESQEKTGTPGA